MKKTYRLKAGDDVFHIPSGLRGIVVPRNLTAFDEVNDRVWATEDRAANDHDVARSCVQSDSGYHIELEDGETGTALKEELLLFYGPHHRQRRHIWSDENVMGWTAKGWWPTQVCPCGSTAKTEGTEEDACSHCETWFCPRCECWVSYDLGCWDDAPAICDKCWGEVIYEKGAA